jgi:hypothetical protein
VIELTSLPVLLVMLRLLARPLVVVHHGHLRLVLHQRQATGHFPLLHLVGTNNANPLDLPLGDPPITDRLPHLVIVKASPLIKLMLHPLLLFA